MKKNHFIYLAFSTALLYWILDAYINVSLYDATFINELLLQSTHTLPFVKLLCAFSIFTLVLTPLFVRSSPSLTMAQPIEIFKELSMLSEILFSSLSTKINTLKSLEKIEELLGLDGVIVFLHTKDSITLYNENAFIQTHFRSKEIFPFREPEKAKGIEQIASTCFLEKRLYSKDTWKDGSNTYIAHSFAIKVERSEKILGHLTLVSHSHDFSPSPLFIERYCEMLSFVLTLSAKKESLEKVQTQFSQENGHYDKALNIMNFIKFQESLEHEYKRQKRYHTEVTLLLIEINLLKNLLNVFPAELVTSFKKEFVFLIRNNIREIDVFGKWNNDQFAILLPNVDFRAAQSVAKKIKLLLETKKFTRIGKVTCSFGITSLSQKDTIGTFRLRAESALSLACSKEGNATEVKLLA